MKIRTLLLAAAPVAFAVVPACSSAQNLDDASSSADAISDGDVATCMAPYDAKATEWKAAGVSAGEVRKRLETAFVTCRDPLTAAPLAAFIGSVNADFTRAGVALAQNKMAYPVYSAVIADRDRKLARAHSDASFVAALSTGDSDADLVPNALDKCDKTADLTATDDNGCPVRVEGCPKELGRCAVGADIQRAIADTPLWFNAKCDDAPPPQTVAPLAWGRGRQGVLQSFGFNILVSRVVNQPAGCDVFYEVEFRFTGGPAGSPDVLYANAIFSENEAIDHSATQKMFPIKFPNATGQRAKIADGFAHYLHTSWRVRATNGSQKYSPWSPSRVQGPAGGGVGTDP